MIDTTDIFFSALRLSRTAMVVTDPEQPDNPIIYVNPAFVTLFGGSFETIIGRNPRIMQSANADPDAVANIRDAIAARRAIEIELLNVKADGSEFLNLLYITPIIDDGGQLLYFLGSQQERSAPERVVGASADGEIAGEVIGCDAHVQVQVEQAVRRADAALSHFDSAKTGDLDRIADVRAALKDVLDAIRGRSPG